MKKLFVLTPLFILFTLSASAQTKRIALLSRAGKLSSMNMKSEGNFGLGPESYRLREIDMKYWDSVFRADSTRLSDSLARLPHKPKADTVRTGAKRIDPAKPQQFAPQKPQPQKAGTWLEKSR
jgi:hypothetical protein